MNPLSIVEDILRYVISSVQSGIGDVLSTIEQDAAQYVFHPVAADINNALSAITGVVVNLEAGISSGLHGIISNVGSSLGTLEHSVASGIQSTVSSVGNSLESIATGIQQDFSALVSHLSEGFNVVKNGVETVFGELVKSLTDGLDKLGNGLLTGLEDIFNPVAHFIEALPGDIETVAKDIGKELTGIGTHIEKLAGEAEKYVQKIVVHDAKNLDTLLSPSTFESGRSELGNTFFNLIGAITGLDVSKMDPLAVGHLAEAFMAEFLLASAVPFDEGLAFLVGNQLPKVVDQIAAPGWRNIRQMANSESPNELLGIGELVEALMRGTIDLSYFQYQMQSHGYSNENSKIIFENAQSLLPAATLVELYYRGRIKDTKTLYEMGAQVRSSKEQMDSLVELRKRLLSMNESIELWRRGIKPEGWQDYFDDARKEGISEERINALKESSYRIPTPFEQKRFTIRQVDDPKIVEKYQYDYKLDQAFIDSAVANGYTPEVAKKLYRDSWQVPPFFITEGLYRAGKLDAQAFSQFMEIDGYTPYFTNLLLEQLQPKLTVADIKDLYKYQVITADQIPAHLKSLGIPDALALQYQELWKASVKLAAPHDQTQSQTVVEGSKKATEGMIRAAFGDHVIQKKTAEQYLKDIGYTDNAVNLIILEEEYKLTQKKIRDTYTLAKDNYVAGNIGLQKALQDIQNSGASHEQVLVYQDDLEKAGRSKPKTPTLANFGDWFKKGIIDLQMFAQAIQFLGYSKVWVPFYLEYYGASPKQIIKAGYGKSVPKL